MEDIEDEEIKGWYQRIAIHKQNLRILEDQYAKFGALHCPPHVLTSIEEEKRNIRELNQRIRRRTRNADKGNVLYNAEEVDEIYDKIVLVAQLEYSIPRQEGTATTLKNAFYWKRQSIKAKFITVGAIFLVINPFIRLILDTLLSEKALIQKLITVLVALTLFSIMAFFVAKWVKNDLFGLIRELDVKSQGDRAELQTQKDELNKIYKIKE